MALVLIEQAITSDSWKPLRLIATDMDGTLTHQGKFTASLLHALEDLSAADIPVLIVTGRSAGWVSGLATYLPVAGAIAENGGFFYPKLFPLSVGVANVLDYASELIYKPAYVTTASEGEGFCELARYLSQRSVS